MNKNNKISSEIVAHSVNQQGDELISVLATFPRIIIAEMNTHRMLSKNTSSSRAIPFNKMVEAVQNDPFMPIAWQKDHKGMQGNDYFQSETGENVHKLVEGWLSARNSAVQIATGLNNSNVTKQLCNRLLEPFMWTTMLITGSREGWDNFFHLRNPDYQIIITKPEEFLDKKVSFKSKKDFIKFGNNEEITKDWTELDWLQVNKGQAEIHMMALAESIWDATNESTPKQLEPGEWHIPFEDKFDNHTLLNETNDSNKLTNLKVKVSVAMAARTSYTIVGEEKGLNYENLIGLHNRLLTQNPPHSSPMEHCARAMSEDEYGSFYKGSGYDSPFGKGNGWCYNLKGFIPYRYFVDNGLVI